MEEFLSPEEEFLPSENLEQPMTPGEADAVFESFLKQLDQETPRRTRADLYQDPHATADFYDAVDREVLSENTFFRWFWSCIYPSSRREK